MVQFLDLEEYSPESKIKTKLFVNPDHISLLKQEGIYTLIILSCGKELKISESVYQVLAQSRQKTSDK